MEAEKERGQSKARLVGQRHREDKEAARGEGEQALDDGHGAQEEAHEGHAPERNAQAGLEEDIGHLDRIAVGRGDGAAVLQASGTACRPP
jgi:hypothetical protein